jgi:hypothetical protein
MILPRLRTVLILATAAAACLLALPAFALDRAGADAEYAQLLTRYVTPRGVRYGVWRATGQDVKALSEVVTSYRSIEPGGLPPDERKALDINLYNSKVLEIVLQGNPKESIKDLSKGLSGSEIFSRALIGLQGKPISLNDLEKTIRDESKDPRVHFALNCAARSCPPIRPEPYDPARLDEQLDDSTRRFLTAPGSVEVQSSGGRTTIVAVKIFEWYADDFKATGGPLAFLQKYGPKEAADAIAAGKARLLFHDYDWSLNASE